MRLHIVHETHYTYSSPVALSHQLLHLTPRALPWQALRAHRIAIEPGPGRDDRARGLLRQPHRAPADRRAARSAAGARRIRGQRSRARRLRSRAARRVGDSARAAERRGPPLEAAEFLYESPHVGELRELADYASKSFVRGRGIVEAAARPRAPHPQGIQVRSHRDQRVDAAAARCSSSAAACARTSRT